MDLEQTLQKRLDEANAKKEARLVSNHGLRFSICQSSNLFTCPKENVCDCTHFLLCSCLFNLQAKIQELNKNLQEKLKTIPKRPRESVKELEEKEK